MRAAQQSAADGLVTATAALVGATTGLGHVGPRPADRGDGREHGLRVDRGAVMASPRIDKVTKVDAARRQISTAIRLFLGRRDTISIHTLVAAAQGSRKEESGGAGRNAWRVLNLADIHIV
jgi:hypothetical protein